LARHIRPGRLGKQLKKVSQTPFVLFSEAELLKSFQAADLYTTTVSSIIIISIPTSKADVANYKETKGLQSSKENYK